MSKSLILLCVSIFAFVQVFCLGQKSEQSRATVQIILVDAGGNDIGIGTVTRFQEETEGKNISNLFKGNIASQIPFGKYNLRVYQRGFYSANRTVIVHQANVSVVVQLDLGAEGGPQSYVISGEVVSNKPNVDKLWIRCQGLYSGVTVDTRTDETGKFQLAGIPAGAYIFSTRREQHVLNLKIITIPPESHDWSELVPVIIKIEE